MAHEKRMYSGIRQSFATYWLLIFFSSVIAIAECRMQEQLSSSEECSSLCLANSRCTHFIWVPDNTCYLTTDSSLDNIYVYKSPICGHITLRISDFSFRDWENGQINWAPRCDFFGLDFHQQKSGYKECGQTCLKNTKCTHFTWEWDGKCYLKTLSKTANISHMKNPFVDT